VEKKNLEQTYVSLGFRSICWSDPQHFVAKLLSVILGGNMSSRLFEEVREKRGLCYDISTELRTHRDTGAFLIHLGLDRMKVPQALQTIVAQLEKIKRFTVGQKELARARDFFIGQIAMALERPQGRMFYMARNFLTLGKILTLSQIKEQLISIRASDIQKLARRTFAFSRMGVACVGNVEDDCERKIREILKKGGRHRN
jgi:predicted Zn-dependent peptidase